MALRVRCAGGDPKPLQAAPVKSWGGERCRKRPVLAGQVCDEKTNVCEPLLTHRNAERWHRNRGRYVTPGQRRVESHASSARRLPVCCPGGVRCKGGVSSSQALAWNRRTCRSDTVLVVVGLLFPPAGREGEPQAANTASGRVPMRGTGTDRPVVAVKAL